jgi:hypothetical protein
MIALARITSRGAEPRGGYFTPFGLHHESDTRPNRARTVLVVLEAPEEGGRTVFPLCGEPVGNANNAQPLFAPLFSPLCRLPSCGLFAHPERVWPFSILVARLNILSALDRLDFL